MRQTNRRADGVGLCKRTALAVGSRNLQEPARKYCPWLRRSQWNRESDSERAHEGHEMPRVIPFSLGKGGRQKIK